MHHNESKLMQNKLCKCFEHEIIKEVVFVLFKCTKIDEIHLPHFDENPVHSNNAKLSVVNENHVLGVMHKSRGQFFGYF